MWWLETRRAPGEGSVAPHRARRRGRRAGSARSVSIRISKASRRSGAEWVAWAARRGGHECQRKASHAHCHCQSHSHSHSHSHAHSHSSGRWGMPRKTRSCFLIALSPLWPCPFIRRCSVISCIGWSWSADSKCTGQRRLIGLSVFSRWASARDSTSTSQERDEPRRVH